MQTFRFQFSVGSCVLNELPWKLTAARNFILPGLDGRKMRTAVLQSGHFCQSKGEREGGRKSVKEGMGETESSGALIPCDSSQSKGNLC